MWFNSMQREEPYLVLTYPTCRDYEYQIGIQVLHGVLLCREMFGTQREPHPTSCCQTLGDARANWRKAGTTSSHHGPYDQGTHVLQW